MESQARIRAPPPSQSGISTSDHFTDYTIQKRAVYVDKSLLIQDVVDLFDKTVALVLRPRRFGKSLNLSMLRSFFAVPTSDQPENLENRRKLFDGLLISENNDTIETHFGKYPVIYLDLKDVVGDSWERMFKNLKDQITDLFQNYAYLLHSSNTLQHSYRLRFQSIYEGTACESDLEVSLFYLSKHLHQFHGQPCLVLIDEYDHPMEHAYNKGYYESAQSFFKSLFGRLLKNNTHLWKAVLVGVLRIAQSGYLSGLNNVQVYSLDSLEQEFSDKFGFTEAEVDQLLLHHGYVSKRDEVQRWYNGYSIGIGAKGIKIFNPWSVMQFLKKGGVLGDYWVITGSTTTIEKILGKAENALETFRKMITGETVECAVDKTVNYSTVRPRSIWTLLYYAGYLTYDSNQWFTMPSEGMRSPSVTYLKIPNEEVRSAWVSWIFDLESVEKTCVAALINLLLHGKVENFRREFKELILDAGSFFDIGSGPGTKKQELHYHLLCLGMALVAGFQVNVKSNRESGTGRSDLMIFPIECQCHLYSVIMEFKVAPSEDTVAALSMQALDQVETKRYRAEVPVYCNRLVELGMSFFGKQVELKARVLEKIDGVWLLKNEI